MTCNSWTAESRVFGLLLECFGVMVEQASRGAPSGIPSTADQHRTDTRGKIRRSSIVVVVAKNVRVCSWQKLCSCRRNFKKLLRLRSDFYRWSWENKIIEILFLQIFLLIVLFVPGFTAGWLRLCLILSLFLSVWMLVHVNHVEVCAHMCVCVHGIVCVCVCVCVCP